MRAMLKAVCTAAITVVLIFAHRPAAGTVIDRIIATVNGEVITLFDLYSAELPVFGKILLLGADDIKKPEDRARERELLDMLIEERLLLQRAREHNLTTTPEEVDAAIETIKSEGNMTDEMFDTALRQRGLELSGFKEGITRRLTINKLIGTEIQLKVVVTPEEVAEEYNNHIKEYTTPERVRIRHILILKQGMEDDTKAKSFMVSSLIAAGADFEEVAREYSSDSSDHKGEISGYIQRGDTLPDLEKVIFELEEGDTSPPIETEMGYHIIQVVDKEPAMTRSIEVVTPEITAHLNKKKIEERHKTWLKEIREQAVIKILF